MSRRHVNILSYAVILGIGAWCLYMSNDLHLFNSKILPLVVSGFMAALAALGLVTELFRSQPEAPVKKREEQSGAARPGREFLWVLPLFALVFACYLLGFYCASFVFVAAYIRLNGGSFKESSICGLCAPLVIYLVFTVLLQVELDRGLLWEVLL